MSQEQSKALPVAAQDVVSAFSAALTEMESFLGDMVRESNCEGGTQFDTVRGYKALWAAQVELENLRAALAAQGEPMTGERPVSNPDELPKGFVPLQRENGKLVYAACLDGGRYHGWLMWKHPDGQWATKRKMTSLEVMQAEDQDHYGIVQDAHHGITAQAKKETP